MATATAPAENTSDAQPDGLLLTVEEAAKRLGFGRTFVYRLIMSGEVESIKVGRLRRVPAACLPEYVAALRRAGKDTAARNSSAA